MTPSSGRLVSWRRAMTLVEVLAVVVILGLLAGTLAVGFSGAFAKGKHELTRTQLGLIAGKLEAYHIEFGAWPDPGVGLDALTDGRASPRASYYMPSDQLLDPWGRRFELIVPGPNGHPFEVVSLGADGLPSGEGEDADLSTVSLRSGQR
ncbi:MAG: type II secretion system protein GspG [Phycisphaeraceae bacterium]|nr:type II secretion system protein GspG [Phycisphaeraceae bacterium]